MSHFYEPEPIPKASDLASELVKRGHEVTVVTGFPNYPSGRLYQGYRLGLVKKKVDGALSLIRTLVYPYHGKSAIGRVLNYGSFVMFAPLGALFSRRPDVMYVWHPPLTIGLAAWIVSRIRRVPFVYDVQDIWPESAVVAGIVREGLATRLMRRLERFIYRRAAHIFVVTEGAKQNLVKKGVPPAKLTVMPHWIDESVFDPEAAERREERRKKFDWQDRFVVLFAGNLGLVQGLESVVRAASCLPEDSKVLVVLMGGGANREHLISLSRQLDLEGKVVCAEPQPMSLMPEIMAAADALLVHLRSSEISDYVIPTKTLAYLAAGRPIIMAMDGASADLISAVGAGITVEPDNPEALATAMDALSRTEESEREQFGVRGRQYAAEHFAKGKVIPLYEKMLERFARKHTPPA